MENWIGITLIICVILYVIRGGAAIDKERKKARDDFMNPPNKPTGLPPIPPPIPIYAITSVEKLTDTHLKRMQKELENHLFSNLAKPHYKIPIIEPPKRKEETNETKENPERKITY